MKNYELVLIFDPALEEAAVEEELSKISSVIEKAKGKIQNSDKWGVRKLAYPIKHQENGYYVITYFSSSTKVLSEIDRINKINDKILRHLIVRTNENN
ncbi:MAG: 30S ribosomal protein S6 [Actinobacteria bacterium]|nr:30S ribosomal protein S6 [Actinomycetota bacterium]